MSAKATFWAWEMSAMDELSASELLVLLKLADNHNEDTGRCDPSIPYIAKKTKLNAKTVKKALRSMHQKSILFISQRTGQTLSFELNIGARIQVDMFAKHRATPPNFGGGANFGPPSNLGGGRGPNLGPGGGPILGPESINNLKDNLKDITPQKIPGGSSGKKLKFNGQDAKTADWMIAKLVDQFPTQKVNRNEWADCVRKMREIDGHELKQIRQLWAWIRNHNVNGGGFSWCLNCRSPMKLRQDKDGLKYFELIWNQMTREVQHGTQPAAGKVTTRRESLAELAERETETILSQREHRAQGQRPMAIDDSDVWQHVAQRTRPTN